MKIEILQNYLIRYVLLQIPFKYVPFAIDASHFYLFCTLLDVEYNSYIGSRLIMLNEKELEGSIRMLFTFLSLLFLCLTF